MEFTPDKSLKNMENTKHPLPTEDSVSRCLMSLASTDNEYAIAKGHLEATRKSEKIVIAGLHEHTKGTVDEKMNAVYRHTDYKTWLKKYDDAIIAYTLLDAKRDRARSVISFWQSLAKARSQGARI